MTKERVGLQFLALWGETPLFPSVRAFAGNLDQLIRNTLRTVLGLLVVMILKRVRERIFFQENKCTGCMVKEGEEVAKPLMVFNLQ